MFRKIMSASIAALSLVAGSLAVAAPAQAAAQVYNPCQKLSEGRVKLFSHGANRVTFATSTDRSQSAVLITGCVRSGGGYVQEWQTTGYAGSKGFSPMHEAWEDTWKSPTGSFSVTEALGRYNPGTSLPYHTLNPNSRWGGEYGPTYNQYFEGAGGPSDENLWYYMNQGYYEQAAVINWNRQPDMPTVQGASYAIFLHAGNVPSAGCLSTDLGTVTRFLQTNRWGDRIIMGAVDDVFSPFQTVPFGDIARKYDQLGGPGRIGNPTGNESGGLKNGGTYQFFERGLAIWNPETGGRFVMGAIRGKWGETGSENGWMGYPATDEIFNPNNYGTHQNYQRGAIYWSPSTGAQIVNAGIRDKWNSNGAENGWMGYPTSGEHYNPSKGGTAQFFQGGMIYWSPTTGSHTIRAGIRAAYSQAGAEDGRLGYPSTDEYISNGVPTQEFQGGTIRWVNGGPQITYK